MKAASFQRIKIQVGASSKIGDERCDKCVQKKPPKHLLCEEYII